MRKRWYVADTFDQALARFLACMLIMMVLIALTSLGPDTPLWVDLLHGIVASIAMGAGVYLGKMDSFDDEDECETTEGK